MTPTTYLFKSIPLSSGSKMAWKKAGAVFLSRDREPSLVIRRLVEKFDLDRRNILLNLGHSRIQDTYADFEEKDHPALWNLASSISPLRTPASTRIALGALMPPAITGNDTDQPMDVWIKFPGRKGAGKFRRVLLPNDPSPIETILARWSYGGLSNQMDMQLHIPGSEYRVVTVNDVVVQAFIQDKKNPNDPAERNPRWVGVKELPKQVRRTAKAAAKVLIDLTKGNVVIGWDIILDDMDQAFVLEGNSCPGVNEFTAKRIIAQLQERRLNSDNH